MSCFGWLVGWLIVILLMGVLAQEAERHRVAAAEAEKKRLAEERVRL